MNLKFFMTYYVMFTLIIRACEKISVNIDLL